MAWLLWLVLVSGCCVFAHGQECNDPTNAAVRRLYNRDCTADTVTIRTALPLTLRRGDTYDKNLVVYGREVTLAEDIMTKGKNVTIVTNALRCSSPSTTISTIPNEPTESQSFEKNSTYPKCEELTCGRNGKNATYVAPQGGTITLVGAEQLCPQLNLKAEGGRGAAGQNGQIGKACLAATPGENACRRFERNRIEVFCKNVRRLIFFVTKYIRGGVAKSGTKGGTGGAGGSAGLPGSGGNITTRFINQTTLPLATAGIGVFPKRALGGAGGNVSCIGASGGTGGEIILVRTAYAPANSKRCREVRDGTCAGQSAKAPDHGQPGIDGPDPQTAPGRVNLYEGTIKQDQLPDVCSLLPYYDQVQLDMILGEGKAQYVARNYAAAGNIFTFLTTLTGPCLSGTAGPSNCNSTFAQAGTNLQQMKQGISFYGRPNNWVPLISASTSSNAIKPLLSALEILETVYVKDYLGKAKDEITKVELQDFISKSVATTREYEAQIAALQQEYNSAAATFADLVDKRTKANSTLQEAAMDFQEEIKDKLRTDAFLTGLQAIASIVTASVPNLLQIGDIYKKVSESKAPALFKDNPEVAGGGVVACSVLSGILKDGLSGYKNVKQGLASLDQADNFKNYVDNEEFENFIASFKTLPGYKTYGKALKSYKDVCIAASAKVLSATGTLNQISSLRGQIDSLHLTASQANERLGRSVNPADALYSSFFEGAYEGLTINIRAYLYQAYQALTYTSLAVSSPDDNKISNFEGLTKAFADFQNAAVQALAQAGGQKQQFKETNTDTTFVVTRDNALNWDEGLNQGRLNFSIPTGTPHFLFSKALVTIDDVDIRYNGARLNSTSGKKLLFTSIEHEGTPFVTAKNCTDYRFVHDKTTVLHTYDIDTGKTTQPATFNRDGLYIRLSPYTDWTLDFSRGNENIDFRTVTSISLAFTGDFAALNRQTCISVRTKGKGVLLVPEVSKSLPAANATTSLAVADAPSTAPSLAAASLAHSEEDACPAVDVSVRVDPTAVVTGDYNFGGILLDDGRLPFELPKYEGVAEIYAIPLEFPLNCTKAFNPPTPIAGLLLLGSAPFEAVAGSTAYAASFSITSEMGMKLKWKLPTLAGGYNVIVNVTSTSDAELYDDTVDACFTYRYALFENVAMPIALGGMSLPCFPSFQ